MTQLWYGPGKADARDFGAHFEGFPCSGTITALFGRTDDVHVTPHAGLDIAPLGLDVPMCALAPGTVRFISHPVDGAWGQIFGNSVIVDHPDGRCTLYGHMRDLIVVVGQNVARGQRLGTVGTTGQSTGVHAHVGMTTQANPWFQKDADGGVSRLLDPLDFIVAAAATGADVRDGVDVGWIRIPLEQAAQLRASSRTLQDQAEQLEQEAHRRAGGDGVLIRS